MTPGLGLLQRYCLSRLSRKVKKDELSYFRAPKKINKMNFNGYNNYYYSCLSNLLCSLINTHFNLSY